MEIPGRQLVGPDLDLEAEESSALGDSYQQENTAGEVKVGRCHQRDNIWGRQEDGSHAHPGRILQAGETRQRFYRQRAWYIWATGKRQHTAVGYRGSVPWPPSWRVTNTGIDRDSLAAHTGWTWEQRQKQRGWGQSWV